MWKWMRPPVGIKFPVRTTIGGQLIRHNALITEFPGFMEILSATRMRGIVGERVHRAEVCFNTAKASSYVFYCA